MQATARHAGAARGRGKALYAVGNHVAIWEASTARHGPTRPAACPRRARDMPAAAHARPRRGPIGLRGWARQRALGAWARAERLLSLGGTCAPALSFF